MRRSLAGIGLVLGLLPLVSGGEACNGDGAGSASSDASSADEPAADAYAADATPADGGPVVDDGASALDPWDAPCSETFAGATIADGWSAPCEVPAPVNVDGGWTDSVALTANGRAMLFAYQQLDFGRFFASSGQDLVATGPLRPEQPAGSGGAFRIFRADLGAHGWIVSFSPLNAPGDSTGEGSASLNVTEDAVVFTRFPPGQPPALTYALLKNGAWTTPTALPFASPCEDDNAFVVGAADGGAARIYFESRRVDGAGTTCGARRLWVLVYDGLDFATPTPVAGLEIPDAGADEDDTQISVSPDERRIYFTSIRSRGYGVFTADRPSTDAPFENVHPVLLTRQAPPLTGQLVLLGEANVANLPQGDVMTLMCGLAGGEDAGVATDIRLRVCTSRRVTR